MREWLPELARMLGAKPPFTIPRWLGRIAAGEHMVVMMTESRAGSNCKARNGLGWAPAHPSWRQGFAELLGIGVVDSGYAYDFCIRYRSIFDDDGNFIGRRAVNVCY